MPGNIGNPPPLPTMKSEVFCCFEKVGRVGGRAGDDVEEDIPLCSRIISGVSHMSGLR